MQAVEHLQVARVEGLTEPHRIVTIGPDLSEYGLPSLERGLAGISGYVVNGVEENHRPALIVDWDPLVVDLDILPSDDPNLLTVNMKSDGRLPVAILGSEDYNVNNIDVNSISINDMIFPVKEPRVEKDENGDGLLDLVIHFSRRDVISGLGLAPDEVPVDITVTATTVTGGPLSGTDSVIPMPTE